ncbi:uncharacterized protein [Panulirus ornatus]|uniref:uncharacterized protein n=1 Tax=Panulirus ornatus TaxID=150431 RepID=UPI003A88A958
MTDVCQLYSTLPQREMGSKGRVVVSGDGGRVPSDGREEIWLKKTGKEEEEFLSPSVGSEPSHPGTDGDIEALGSNANEDIEALGSNANEDIEALGLNANEDIEALGSSTDEDIGPDGSNVPANPRNDNDPCKTSGGHGLPSSYDFAKDDEAKERLRAELEKLRQEKIAKGIKRRIIRAAGGTMDEDRVKVLVTWVGRTEGVKHVKKAMKELLRTARAILPPGGATYTICEDYDTYQKGGLYPVLHLSEESATISKFLNGNHYLEPDGLGPDNMLDQGMFEEVASVSPPLEGVGTTNTVLAVSAFKSIEPSPNAKLIKEWKQWTGARAFLQDIMMAGLQCHKIRFLVKVAPFDEPGGFYYILLTEVAIHEPSNEGMIVDILQRFRVERWSGYNTIYRKAEFA